MRAQVGLTLLLAVLALPQIHCAPNDHIKYIKGIATYAAEPLRTSAAGVRNKATLPALRDFAVRVCLFLGAGVRDIISSRGLLNSYATDFTESDLRGTLIQVSLACPAPPWPAAHPARYIC